MDTTDSKGVPPPPPRQAAATPVSAAMSALDLAAVAGAAAANPGSGDESKVYQGYSVWKGDCTIRPKKVKPKNVQK